MTLNLEMRRLSKAQQALDESFIRPIQELIEASAEVARTAEQRAFRAETLLEVLRPVWAQGHSTDSEAAQAHGNALSEIWQKLGVTDQTAAMARLRELLP